MRYAWYAVAIASVLSSGCRDHPDDAAHAPAQSDLNAVQREMQLLTGALETAVRGVGSGDVRAVAHDLHEVHAAKEATEAAIRDGSYRPPKNPDRLQRFAELDEAFHDDLVSLVAASRRNDVPGAAKALGTVLGGCQGCHREFRD